MISEETKALRKAAAEKAVADRIEDGMTVGLGTGNTASYAIRAIGRLVSEQGYRLTCVATSRQTEDLARSLGIKVVDVDEVDHIDVTIDGADEVDRNLQLIKGLGGALLREKIVAAATVSEVIIVDGYKVVDVLGEKTPLPVEVVPFGHEHTAKGLKMQGCEPALRVRDGKTFISDGGNVIYDCKFNAIQSPFFIQSAVDTVPGVVECGLFLNMAESVYVAQPDGRVDVMTRRRGPRPPSPFIFIYKGETKCSL